MTTPERGHLKRARNHVAASAALRSGWSPALAILALALLASP